MKKIFSSIVVALFILFANQATNAQCVGCSASESGFSCVAQQTGGSTCRTANDSRSCTVSGLCGVKKPKLDNPIFYLPIDFSQTSILGVATSHPRLAETLIQLQGRTLAEINSGQISWMPGETSYQDIKQMLDPNSDKQVLAEALQIRDKKAYQQGYQPISYTFTIEKTNEQTVILHIQR